MEIASINGRLCELRDLRKDFERGDGNWARELMEARRELARSVSMAERAGWRDKRLYRKQADMRSKKEAEALNRWAEHGASEVNQVDTLVTEGETAIKELTALRDLGLERRNGFQQRSTHSVRSLSEFRQHVSAYREHLDGVEWQSVNRAHPNRSRLRSPRGLDHGRDHVIQHDLGPGLGR